MHQYGNWVTEEGEGFVSEDDEGVEEKLVKTQCLNL